MSTASDRLQKYLDAETAILAGQEVRLNGRMRRLPDIQWVQSSIVQLQRQVDSETRVANDGSSLRHQLPDFSS